MTTSTAAEPTTSTLPPGTHGFDASQTFGGGPFTLVDQSVGLAALPSYTATLTVTFTGTADGAASTWTETSTLLATADPAVRVLTIDRTGDDSDPPHELTAVAAGASYTQTADGSCVATPADPAAPLILEPAADLPTVIGGDAAGSDPVGDVPADHFSFGEEALGLAGVSTSTGSVALATTGGYVVTESVTSSGTSDLFGEGVEGMLQLDYSLTNVGATIAALPADCPPGRVPVAPVADAANIHDVLGSLTFDTPTAVADAVAFYLGEIAKGGWVAVADPDVQDESTEIDFTRGTEILYVTIAPGDAGTTVHMSLAPIQPDAT